MSTLTNNKHCTLCNEKVLARGLCRRHYDQWRRTDPAQVEKFNAANRRYMVRRRSRGDSQ